MRVLLDENIPVQLKGFLTTHQVASVNDSAIGWKNITNGRSLVEMDGRFDLLITADKNIYSQQNLANRPISILVLPTNKRRDVIASGAQIADIVDAMGLGEYAVLDILGTLNKRRLV